MLLNSNFYKIPEQTDCTDSNSETRLVVYSHDLKQEESALLAKILSATGLQSDAIVHYIIQDKANHVKSLFNHEKSFKIIAFLCDPQDLGLQIDSSKYKSIHVHNCEVVFLDDLKAISDNPRLKKYLWELLKKWFISS